jgi:uncharacterized protein
MDAEHIKLILSRHKAELFSRYPLKSLALFGSYTDGTATDESDVDILVEFTQPVGFEIVDLVIELEGLLNKKVDLVSRKAIRPRYLPFVNQQLQYV